MTRENLSQFDLAVEYVPGAENLVVDAMSRWAYPAASSRQDVSWHGTREAKEEWQISSCSSSGKEGRSDC